MHSLLARVVPVYTPVIVNQPELASPLMVCRGALRPLFREKPLSVLVDHDPEQRIGTVLDLYTYKDVDHGTRVRDWWFARCELDEAPGWLKRGSGVSWGVRRSADDAGWRDDAAVLRGHHRDQRPDTCHEAGRAARAGCPGPRGTAAKEILVGADRPRPATGEVLYGGGRIVRPGIGQVLGVR